MNVQVKSAMDIDFTSYRHPVLAVNCPNCNANPGAWCRRPSGHDAADFHSARKKLADEVFIEIHGQMASIDLAVTGWLIDPSGRMANDQQLSLTL